MNINSCITDKRIRQHFDGQGELYVDRHRHKHISICAERVSLLNRCGVPCATGSPRLLDIGCGAGYLSDEFLRQFPGGRAVAMDVSAGLLARNIRHTHKRLLVADARSIPVAGEKFDVINFDTVLHHIIHSGGYRCTIAGIGALLSSLRTQLTPHGTIMIREIYHEFRLCHSLACRLLFQLTSTQLPRPLASLVRRLGINTANVGVCFLTRKQWRRIFRETGLEIISEIDHRWPSPLRFAGLRSGEIYYYLTFDTSRAGIHSN